jgi:hypothetical protein
MGATRLRTSGKRFKRRCAVGVAVAVAVVGRTRLMRATGTARLGAGTQRFIENGLDGACAATALGTAAEASVELLGIPGQIFRAVNGTANIVVGQDVTGTNNHESVMLIGAAETHRY